MRILQILYSLAPGGAERLVVDISNELSQQGHDVTLCVLRDDLQHNFGFFKKDLSDDINYINLLIPVGFRLSNIAVLYRLIKKTQPEIVHCHLNLVNYLFPLTLLFPKIKFYHTIHSIPKREVRTWLEYWIRRYFYTSLKMRAITISAETSRGFVDYYKTQNYSEILNGRTSPKPTNLCNEVMEYIQTFRDSGNMIFLHIGSFSPVKNQLMLISVFNRLVAEGRSLTLLIIGPGFDSEEGETLKSKACDRVIFLGVKHNVSDYLLNADAFCLSSTSEGMPISLIEAMSCGCLPICTPVGGLINIIKNGENGYLSASVSEQDYYEVVNHYIENKDKINKTDLIRFYKNHFSIEECVNKHVILYSQKN